MLVAALASLAPVQMQPQGRSPQSAAQVEGSVRDSAGKPLAGVAVVLTDQGRSSLAETRTNADGAFSFSAIPAGTYSVKLKKPGFRAEVEDSIKLSTGAKKHCEFVLATSEASSSPSSGAISPSVSRIELDDRPNFSVAGITDSTGSGGHGSETRMRTGEALAKETLNLEPGKSEDEPTAARKAGAAPETRVSEKALRAALVQNRASFSANSQLGEFYFHSERCREAIPLLEAAYQVNPADHVNSFDLVLALKACGDFAKAREHARQVLTNEKELSKHEEADLRRWVGDLDEKLGDPLETVREYERVVGLDPSEQNYFAWGSELLLHRATAPAIEVFGRGVRLHPDSARMLAGLGAGLYTSGSLEEAAQRLCEASDLEPANPAPYLFLGKMQESASRLLPCAEQKLARFAQDRPSNALANYYYALALWKQNRGSEKSGVLAHAEALLQKAAEADPKLDAAYLQLGNLHLARGAFQGAVDAYQRAITANPSGSEAHYRLGLAYKRLGEEVKAQNEFDQYKQLDKSEAATIERQRRELRQFLYVLKDQPVDSHPTLDTLSPAVPR
jgi:tetratricopeptide (TPR) repeat protein